MRMNGVIARVLLTKGFAFVRGEDRLQRFLHSKDVTPVADFDTLYEGQAVTFIPVVKLDKSADAKNNGLKARDVQVVR